MERTFKVFFTLLGLLASTYAFPVLLAASDTPTIIISEAGENFGELSEKTPVSHDFIVKNGGKATLNIEKVQPS